MVKTGTNLKKAPPWQQFWQWWPPQLINLSLVLAYSSLDMALGQLADEGWFNCKGRTIGPKMTASKSLLQWQDYELVWEGKNARDAIAHEAKLVSRDDAIRFIAAVENELKAWNII